MDKKCTACELVKPLTKFGSRVQKGIRYPATRCYSCRNAIRRAKGQISPSDKACSIRKNEKSKEDRAANLDVPKLIYWDSRGSDRRKERENDLDIAFIKSLVTKPCAYCGEQPDNTRMTLDRIDNSIGHIKTNVIQACHRCNHIKSDMPKYAWDIIAPSIKQAREVGAFEEWRKTRPRPTGGTGRRGGLKSRCL